MVVYNGELPIVQSVKHHLKQTKESNADANGACRGPDVPRDAPGCAGVLSPPLDP